MGAFRVVVDRERCTAIGVCESLLPGRFEVDEDAELIIHEGMVTDDEQAEMERVVAACPASALRLVPEDA